MKTQIPWRRSITQVGFSMGQDYPASIEVEDMPPKSQLMPSDHFDGKRFFNPDGRGAQGLAAVIRWKFSSSPELWPEDIPVTTYPPPPRNVAEDELRITLVNHSTVLIQIRDCNILTDPIWSKRASPIPWAGPTR